jgi:hypothetical protein
MFWFVKLGRFTVLKLKLMRSKRIFKKGMYNVAMIFLI